MPEVVVVAILTAKPGAEAQVEQLMREVTPPTHAEEGCITYAIHRDLDDPCRLVFVERWTDRAVLDAHLAAPHLDTFRAGLDGLLATPTQVFVLAGVPAGEPAKGSLSRGE